MTRLRLRMATPVAVLCLGLLTASPIAAQGRSGAAPGGEKGNGSSNAGGNGNSSSVVNKPSLAETPELTSLALFGTGVAGLAGYTLMRIRAGRRHDDHEQPTQD